MDNFYQSALVGSVPANQLTGLKEVTEVFCLRFSSPTSSSEAKPEKPAETRNDSINEMQENQKVRKWHQLM